MSLYKLSYTKPVKLGQVFLLALALAVIISSPASAAPNRIGVGISTGKIELKDKLKPGLSYGLPTVAVFNNGNVASEYEMSVQFNEKQDEYKPEAKWVSFSPQKFTLKPGKAQQVSMKIRASASARPGSYFAYLEAHPLKKDVSGKSAINIAAATKFSFDVAPANIFQKLFYFLVDLWNRYKPVIIGLAVIIVSAVMITGARRNLTFEIKTKRPASEKPATTKKSNNKKH